MGYESRLIECIHDVEEAATYYEEAAANLRKQRNGLFDMCDPVLQEEQKFVDRAKEYRDIAEFLQELKSYKEKEILDIEEE